MPAAMTFVASIFFVVPVHRNRFAVDWYQMYPFLSEKRQNRGVGWTCFFWMIWVPNPANGAKKLWPINAVHGAVHSPFFFPTVAGLNLVVFLFVAVAVHRRKLVPFPASNQTIHCCHPSTCWCVNQCIEFLPHIVAFATTRSIIFHQTWKQSRRRGMYQIQHAPRRTTTPQTFHTMRRWRNKQHVSACPCGCLVVVACCLRRVHCRQVGTKIFVVLQTVLVVVAVVAAAVGVHCRGDLANKIFDA